MKLTLGPPWKCDKCQQSITSAEDGWLQWLTSSTRHSRAGEITLVHRFSAGPHAGHGGCIYASGDLQKQGLSVSDLQVTAFFGPSGLVSLLALLVEDHLQLQPALDIIQRLHVPGHEAARPYFKEAVAAGAFEPNTEPNFYMQHEIEATLEYAKNQRGHGGA